MIAVYQFTKRKAIPHCKTRIVLASVCVSVCLSLKKKNIKISSEKLM